MDDSPVATFTLTNKNGLHLRLRNIDHSTFAYKNMVPLTSVIGKWTQAFVQVNYKRGNTSGSSNSGSIRVILKDQNAALLYDQVFYHDMFWAEADFVRPKWGLYRQISDLFQSADWELFQNVQIWKKLIFFKNQSLRLPNIGLHKIHKYYLPKAFSISTILLI